MNLDPLRDVFETFKRTVDALRDFVSFTQLKVFLGAFLNFLLYFLSSGYLLDIWNFVFYYTTCSLVWGGLIYM